MKKSIYLLIIMLLVSFGCEEDFLDTNPFDGLSSSQIFESDDNALFAMNGVYNTIAFTTFYDNFYIYVACLGPEGYGVVRGNWGMAHSQGLATSRDGVITNNYRNFYKPIIYANDVIAGLTDNENVSEELRNRLIGEAKFIRGLCYFYLWNLWGGVIILEEPTPPTETYLARNSAEEVKEFIIQDFTDAIAALPESYPDADLGRATKGAAIAMLGKTYLYDEQWPAAAAEFEKLLGAPYAYDLVPEYRDLFRWMTQNNEESVFELQYVMEPGLGSSFDNRFGNRSMRQGGQDYCEVSPNAFKVFTYEDGSPIDLSTIPQESEYADEVSFGVDLINWYETTMEGVDVRLHESAILPGATYVGRGDITYKVYWPYGEYVNADPPSLRTTFPSDALIPIRKFLTIGEENIGGRENGPTNYPLIRFADILLMYAEAINETNGPTEAVYNAVNRIRSRAGIVDLPTGLSQDEMRRNIWLERYKEFMFEGHLYFDVKRWNVAHTNDPIFGLNHDVLDFKLNRIYTKVFEEDRDYLWPIPGLEMDLNAEINQNPNW